jgi:IclR-like helix-turn-helix domain-containing protein
VTAPFYASPVAIDPMAGAETGPVIRSTGVGVLDRVVAVLDAVETRRMTASELARHLGLSVPTAHRLVGSMMTHGLLSRDDSGRLRLGHRFAVPYLEHVGASVLTDLQQQTGDGPDLGPPRGAPALPGER